MATPEARRGRIAAMLEYGDLNATALAGELGVSRQTIVSDIAILKERGYAIESTPRGYRMAHKKRTGSPARKPGALIPPAAPAAEDFERDGRNLTMLIDFYELTMSNGYYVRGLKDVIAVFDLFFRNNPDQAGYSVFAGLEQVIWYIQNMRFTQKDIEYLRSKRMFDEGFLTYLINFRFTGTLTAVREGTVVYPNTPLITVRAPLIEAQLIETALLNIINHQSLIATKANRIRRAARGATVMEFGARRAQGADAAHYGARAAYIGGVDATATVSADRAFGVPATGTMAHSWVQLFENEFEAFKAYAEIYPDACTLLIDTYSVIKSGLPNAIRVANEVLAPMGKRLKGVRIDSGDLAYLSKRARETLDAAGLTDCRIIVSNSIDEYLLMSLAEQGARIDGYGIGERLITAKSEPVFGGVYKLAAIRVNGEYEPRIKVSENADKITNPGYKELWRAYNPDGKAIADVLALRGEDPNAPGFEVVDSLKPWKRFDLAGAKYIKLHEVIFDEGALKYATPPLNDIRAHLNAQLDTEIWPEETRFSFPHRHYLDLSARLYALKMDMIASAAGVRA